MLIYSFSFAQLGVGVEPPDASAELEIQSTQKGLLIPRLTDAQMTTLGTGAGVGEESLLIYNTTQKAFFAWDGAAWQQVGGICNEITDEDGDTKIVVENTLDEDKIRVSSLGSEKIVIDNSSTTISNGDLTINNGSLIFDSEYFLPESDGINDYILGIDNSGEVVWRNPAAALGLVVGIETSSFTNIDQNQNISTKTYYVRVMPWSTITVTKMAFVIKSVSAPSTPEIGIYDNAGNRLTTGIGAAIAATSPRLVEIDVTPYTLTAGQIYWFALTDNTGDAMTVYDQIFASGNYSCRQEIITSLPATTTFPLNGEDKGIWIAAY